MSQSRPVSPEGVMPFVTAEPVNFPDREVRRPEECANVYPISQLKALLGTAKPDDSDDEDLQGDSSKTGVVLRFLLNSYHELNLGHEGFPSAKIPAHKRLLRQGNCIAAGNLYVDSAGTLYKINHKSGDFRPSFQSLQFALLQLKNAGIAFKDIIEVEQLTEAGGTEQIFQISSAQLNAYLASMSVTIPRAPANPLPALTSTSSNSSSSAQKRGRDAMLESSRENSRPTSPSHCGMFSGQAVTPPASPTPPATTAHRVRKLFL